jgi:hypothetical protein
MSSPVARADGSRMSVRVDWNLSAPGGGGSLFRVASVDADAGLSEGWQVSTVVAASCGGWSRAGGVGVDVHLRADPDVGWGQEWADVLVGSAPVPSGAARGQVMKLLGRFPGCLVAAVPDTRDGCVLGARGGAVLSVIPVGARGMWGWSVVASFLHGWLVSGGVEQGLKSVVLYQGHDLLVRLKVQES